MASQPLVKTVTNKAQAQRATADVIGKIQKQSLGGLFSKEGNKKHGKDRMGMVEGNENI